MDADLQAKVCELVEQHIKSPHSPPTFTPHEGKTLVTVQIHAPYLSIEEFAGLGISVGETFPGALAVGPNVMQDSQIRFLI